MHTVYEGQLVRLRPFRDADEMLQLVREEHAEPNAHWGPMHHSGHELRRQFDGNGMLSADGSLMMCIERLDTGEVAGYEEVGPLTLPRLVAWVGTFIRPLHQKRGFGMEAKQLMFCLLFENLPLQCIMADTLSTHAPARRGLELSGMNYIGCRPAVHYRQGSYEAVVYYHLTRSDWAAMDYRHAVRRAS
ncbi:GNAT family N-acetyltransferase [bacterium]|nr:GNAT family N-acetyltransferase [bacterium]